MVAGVHIMYVLLVALRVRRASIQSPEAATLSAENLFRRLLVHVKSSGKISLLLFYMFQGLVDVVLLPLGGEHCSV